MSIWSVETESLAADRQKYRLTRDQRAVTFADVVAAWREDGQFRTFFNGLLADAPYTAFRWETPAVTKSTFDQSFEFVLIDNPGLARTVDRKPFAKHFRRAKSDAVSFSNLGGDAVLVVPCPVVDDDKPYGNLAAFVRQAPADQADRLWQEVGHAMQQRVSDKPVWLSTAGMGVSWLHVRLDDRPKYYGHGPYRVSDAS